MPERPKNLVPAKYIGNHAVELGEGTITYHTDGSRRRSNTIEVGDELLMRDEDVYGKTLWHDPRHEKPSIFVGLGKRVMDEDHLKMSHEELGRFGYEFHQKRDDFEPLLLLDDYLAKSKPISQPQQQAIASSVTLTDATVHIEEVPENAEYAESEQE